MQVTLSYVRVHLEWNLPNPVQGRMLKEPEGRVRWLTIEQSEKLIEVAQQSRSPYLADLIVPALNTGMRRDEHFAGA